MKLLFATGNQNKVEEIRSLLPEKFQLLSLTDMGFDDEIPETAATIEGNSQLKARFCYHQFKKNCFADDTGLEVEVLNGAPGVHSARYAGIEKDNEKNINLLLDNLKGVKNRNARFKTVITLILDGELHQFTGVVNGKIRQRRSGSLGFGYDSVFEPDNHKLTFAEMTLDVKNRISHRSKAFEQLVQFLKQASFK